MKVLHKCQVCGSSLLSYPTLYKNWCEIEVDVADNGARGINITGIGSPEIQLDVDTALKYTCVSCEAIYDLPSIGALCAHRKTLND